MRLQKRLVGLNYTREGLEMVIREFASGIKLFREANVPLEAEISALETQWSKLNGEMSVQWHGEEYTPEGLAPFLLAADRGVREQAFKLKAQPYLARREELAAIFDRMYVLRAQIAHNAGFGNYRDYAHTAMCRFDYTPADCLRFHEAVEVVAKPAAARILEKRRVKMGLGRLRPWDLAVDAQSRPALAPFIEERILQERAGRMMAQVDPVFGEYYAKMVKNDLLDLSNRKGKAPGGYCGELPWSRLPLILMNAVGLDEDVRALLHESGHAFHAFEAYAQPLIFQRNVGMEIAAVASMSMELLAAPYLEEAKGGFYSAPEARRSRIALLEEIILFLPHCASVDAWQQWAYTQPQGADVAAREAKWLELRVRFEGESVDWIGVDWKKSGWRVGISSHIFFSTPSTTLSTGLRSWGRCKFGTIADKTQLGRWLTIEHLWRWAAA